MAEPPSLRVAELLIARQGVAAPDDEIVEVEQAPLALRLLVHPVQLGHLRQRARGFTAGRGDDHGVAVGSDESGLGPLDLAGDLHRRDGALGPRRSPCLAQHRGEESDLAVEQRRHRPTPVPLTRPQLREGDRVERARGDPVAHAETAEAGHELTGRLAGEGEREHVLGIDVVLS